MAWSQRRYGVRSGATIQVTFFFPHFISDVGSGPEKLVTAEPSQSAAQAGKMGGISIKNFQAKRDKICLKPGSG